MLEERVKGRKVLVVGIGGGGDVASAFCVYRWLRAIGAQPYLASIIWERMVRDPVPGPISPKELVGTELGKWIGIVRGGEYALREGKKVEPQASLLAKAAGIEVIVLDLKSGYKGMLNGLKEALELTEAEIVIGVDAGGDVLAKPGDEEVWSPLADSVGLAALKEFENSILSIAGPGCDGELPTQKVLERIAEVWRRGGNEGGFIISRSLASECEKAMSFMHTEASKMVIEAAKGVYGEVKIRRGSRTLFLSPVLASIFHLDASKVESELAEAVRGTESVEEASTKLLERCSTSEYELEKELKTLGGWSKENLEEAKRRVLMKRKCS
ncbi:hypothetical protein IPA_01920 [Ignicoccus pacificus DSM 13166]|uniref:DUF1152 domain-containing protein n=1 Tax=Ignicoccus pacificus DSM 13166 TaxID=940294 RepID=A0A977PL49_9CREN|nr:hypothetical protein IPA_01920 [Ignicoccus pacificus DSM 13166]